MHPVHYPSPCQIPKKPPLPRQAAVDSTRSFLESEAMMRTNYSAPLPQPRTEREKPQNSVIPARPRTPGEIRAYQKSATLITLSSKVSNHRFMQCRCLTRIQLPNLKPRELYTLTHKNTPQSLPTFVGHRVHPMHPAHTEPVGFGSEFRSPKKFWNHSSVATPCGTH